MPAPGKRPWVAGPLGAESLPEPGNRQLAGELPEPGELPRILPARDPAAVRAAIAALKTGGLVAVPTETVYGIACLLEAAAIERLLEAKHRPPTRGITLLVDDLAQAASVGELPPTARRLAARFWPGPLTLVVPIRPGRSLPPTLTGDGGSIGLRVPGHPTPRALARALGPLPLTSANLSGAPDGRDAAEVVRQLGRSVAVVLDDGPSPGGVPSTVVRVAGSAAQLEVLRAGALPLDLLLAAATG
ncbi:MAG: L-threonylcarbamoyladenylate synthase [Candidatus Limnocylindrales bacterium]